MLRFVDLTESYWGGDGQNMLDNPCCAFINTVNDRFVEVAGTHRFGGPEDFAFVDGDMAIRLSALVPAGFWSRR
jgi:hypothetical protein